jgi:hypothetical protein
MAVTSRPLKPTRAPVRAGKALTWLLQASVFALALLALTLAVNAGLAWAQRTLDDLRYGVPRTTHLAGVVGGGDSAAAPTRFIGLNSDGQISVLVLPGGDVGRLAVLQGPYVIGDTGSTAVPLLSLADLTGDGAPDLLVTIRGEVVVYANHDGTFALLTPEERARLAAPAGRRRQDRAGGEGAGRPVLAAPRYCHAEAGGGAGRWACWSSLVVQAVTKTVST